MTRPVSPTLLALLAAALILAVTAGSPARDGVLLERLTPAFSELSLPLSFEENRGQADASVAFIARSGGFDVYATEDGPVFAVGSADGSASVRMALLGGRAEPVIQAGERLPGTVNYFLGNDPEQWRTGIATYERVTYEGAYPGIDLVLYGDEGQLRYDFVVAPGADPSLIQMAFAGADGLALGQEGELRMSVGQGELTQPAPFIYQERGTSRHRVKGGFALTSDTVGFEVGDYDAGLPLVIDPAIVFGSYLGGSETDSGNGIAVGEDGSVFVTGHTGSLNFPTVDALQEDLGGQLGEDAFITRINPVGDAVIYSTYLGGNGSDRGYDVEVDSAGQATVAGTGGDGFPTTPGAFNAAVGSAGFVTRLSNDGSELIYSTKLGTNTEAYGLDLDDAGNAYIAGSSLQAQFEATAGSFQPDLNGNGDGIIAVLNPDGTDLVWGSYIGGTGREFAHDVAVDEDLYVYLAGVTPSDDFPVVNAFQAARDGTQPDAFVARIMPGGGSLVYATYLGGQGGGLSDRAFGIDADDDGNAYVTGQTNSDDFPVSANRLQDYGGGEDAFVTKFGPTGDMVYSTYLGGSSGERGAAIHVDADGNAHVAGRTVSNNFPTNGAIQDSSGGSTDAFVARLNAAGTGLTFSTYLGGSGSDLIGETGGDEDGDPLALDEDGGMYVTGRTASNNFPVLDPFQANLAGDEDAFVVKIGEGTPFGDIDCGGSVDPIDALKLLRYDGGLDVVQPELCLNIGDLTEIGGVQIIWGDVDCSGEVNPVDALKLLRFDAGLSVQQAQGCPAIGILLA